MKWMAAGEVFNPATEDLKIQAVSKIPIEIILTNRDMIEFCSFQTWFKRVFFIDKNLWQNLQSDQREVLLLWGYCSQVHAPFLIRIAKQSLISPIDRDSLIQGAQLKSLLTTLVALDQFRSSHPLTPFGHIISGLSALGPSLLEPWQNLKERESKLLGYLADWGKAG